MPQGTVIKSGTPSPTPESDPSQDTPPAEPTSDQPTGEPEGTPSNHQDGPTDDDFPSYATPEYIRALEDQLREQNRTIQALANRETAPAPAQPAPPPEDPDEARQRFYNEPHNEVRRIIKAELDESIAPLRDFVTSFRQSSVYDNLKTKFKSDPAYRALGHHLNDATIESAVDEIMQQVPEKNDTAMQQAIIHALGLKAAGVLTAKPAANGEPPVNTRSAVDTPQPSTQPGGRSVPQPAHFRPSNPNPPRPSAPARRQLTELERRVARERGMSDEQYLNWLELPADAVVHADKDGKVGAK